MSARLKGHFLPIFDGFSSELPGITEFQLKIVVCHFGYFFTYLVQYSVRGGATFNFRPFDICEYILNMTSYHVTEAFNG